MQSSDEIGNQPLQIQEFELVHVSTSVSYQFAVDHLSQYQDNQAEYLYQELPVINPKDGSHANGNSLMINPT